ncbi:hypothetical protein [Chryseobacterium sp. ZHDP1]|uniref:hypothetical protein n=1 Tax=Chryseobacterium sp. ZHDP1 TaxID=2838877 RepID=UPI001BE0B5F4|nr:hypothetical protein [Chryseobacterium sp. ZHDP1]QWA38860.1 hypothetical protein KKI44_01210 [Chryseobacterium sp. ZHDP1]
MKVKLLKKIRTRFSIVPKGYEFEPYRIYQHNIFDDKTAEEHVIFGNETESILMYICHCLDTPFFKYSAWFNRKLIRRRSAALRKKYFPFRKK